MQAKFSNSSTVEMNSNMGLVCASINFSRAKIFRPHWKDPEPKCMLEDGYPKPRGKSKGFYVFCGY